MCQVYQGYDWCAVREVGMTDVLVREIDGAGLSMQEQQARLFVAIGSQEIHSQWVKLGSLHP